MCGRFTLHVSPEQLAAEFDFAEVPALGPRYNIAPSQAVFAVRLDDGARRPAMLRWGLIPSWAKDPKIAYRLINARSETADGKPAFREAFRKRRCLIVADGFFEWKKEGKAKQPFYIRRADGRPFGFAGLWERWTPPNGEPVETCTVLTTNANKVLAPLHDRMPVILETNTIPSWLDLAQAAERLKTLLRPLPDEALTAFPVSSLVNSPRNEGPKCIEPAPVESPLLPWEGRLDG